MLQLAWAFNWRLLPDDGRPTVTFSGPTPGVWYNTDQSIGASIADTGSFPASGVAGFSYAWNAPVQRPDQRGRPRVGQLVLRRPAIPEGHERRLGPGRERPGVQHAARLGLGQHGPAVLRPGPRAALLRLGRADHHRDAGRLAPEPRRPGEGEQRPAARSMGRLGRDQRHQPLHRCTRARTAAASPRLPSPGGASAVIDVAPGTATGSRSPARTTPTTPAARGSASPTRWFRSRRTTARSPTRPAGRAGRCRAPTAARSSTPSSPVRPPTLTFSGRGQVAWVSTMRPDPRFRQGHAGLRRGRDRSTHTPPRSRRP